MELYHGAHSGYTLHDGQCYTDDLTTAEHYARGGAIATVELDLTGLVVEDLGVGFDHDDPGMSIGDLYEGNADVIIYDDEDGRGRRHTTYRIMSDAAVAAVTILEIEEE